MASSSPLQGEDHVRHHDCICRGFFGVQQGSLAQALLCWCCAGSDAWDTLHDPGLCLRSTLPPFSICQISFPDAAHPYFRWTSRLLLPPFSLWWDCRLLYLSSIILKLTKVPFTMWNSHDTYSYSSILCYHFHFLCSILRLNHFHFLICRLFSLLSTWPLPTSSCWSSSLDLPPGWAVFVATTTICSIVYTSYFELKMVLVSTKCVVVRHNYVTETSRHIQVSIGLAVFCVPYLRWKHPEWDRPIRLKFSKTPDLPGHQNHSNQGGAYFPKFSFCSPALLCSGWIWSSRSSTCSPPLSSAASPWSSPRLRPPSALPWSSQVSMSAPAPPHPEKVWYLMFGSLKRSNFFIFLSRCSSLLHLCLVEKQARDDPALVE